MKGGGRMIETKNIKKGTRMIETENMKRKLIKTRRKRLKTRQGEVEILR